MLRPRVLAKKGMIMNWQATPRGTETMLDPNKMLVKSFVSNVKPVPTMTLASIIVMSCPELTHWRREGWKRPIMAKERTQKGK